MLPKPAFDPDFPLAKVKLTADRPRDTDLAKSIAQAGLIHPPSLMADGTVICGNGRIEAARSLGWEKIPAFVYQALDPLQLQLKRLVENIAHSQMTDQAIFQECSELERGGMPRKDIADAMGKSAGSITRYLSPNACPEEALQAFLAGKLNFGQTYKISTSPEPLETLRQFLGGASISAVKPKRKAKQAAEAKPEGKGKPKAVPIALTDGMVVVRAEKVSMATVIKLLADAHRQAKAGHGAGLGLRAFVGSMRDKAAAPQKPKLERKSRKRKEAVQ